MTAPLLTSLEGGPSNLQKVQSATPPSASTGSRPQEAVPTEGHDASVLADAERFRALMRCGRIKMQGSSGVDAKTGERNGNNVHFGAEFWPHPPKPEYAHLDGGERSTKWGRACLRALADAILEHEAATPQPADGCSSNEGADGWIEWRGGENPVPGQRVWVRCLGYSEGPFESTVAEPSEQFSWRELGASTIIAYRILPQTEKGS